MSNPHPGAEDTFENVGSDTNRQLTGPEVLAQTLKPSTKEEENKLFSELANMEENNGAAAAANGAAARSQSYNISFNDLAKTYLGINPVVREQNRAARLNAFRAASASGAAADASGVVRSPSSGTTSAAASSAAAARSTRAGATTMPFTGLLTHHITIKELNTEYTKIYGTITDIIGTKKKIKPKHCTIENIINLNNTLIDFYNILVTYMQYKPVDDSDRIRYLHKIISLITSVRKYISNKCKHINGKEKVIIYNNLPKLLTKYNNLLTESTK